MASNTQRTTSSEPLRSQTENQIPSCTKFLFAVAIIAGVGSLFLIAFGGAGLGKALTFIDISHYYYIGMTVLGAVGFVASVAGAIILQKKILHREETPPPETVKKKPPQKETVQEPEKKGDISKDASQSLEKEDQPLSESLLGCIRVHGQKKLITPEGFELVNFCLRLELEPTHLNVSDDEIVKTITSTAEKLKQAFGPCCVSVYIQFNAKTVDAEQFSTLYSFLSSIADKCPDVVDVKGNLKDGTDGCFGKTDWHSDNVNHWEQECRARKLPYARQLKMTEKETQIILDKFNKASKTARQESTVHTHGEGAATVVIRQNKQYFTLEDLSLLSSKTSEKGKETSEAPLLPPELVNALTPINKALIDIYKQYRTANQQIERADKKYAGAAKDKDEKAKAEYEKQKKDWKAMRDSLNAKHEECMNEKIALIKKHVPKGYLRFVALAIPGKMPAKAMFYHATSDASVDKILTQGVRTRTTKETEVDGKETKFDKPELGQGLYCSLSTAGYAGDGYDRALVLYSLETIPTVRIPYRSDLKKSMYQPLELDEAAIQEGLTYIETHYDVMQREALPPRDNELVIRNPKHRFRVEGVLKPLISMPEEPWVVHKDHDALHTKDAFWHASWKPSTDKAKDEKSTYETVKKIDDNGRRIVREKGSDQELFFKPLRGKQEDFVIEGEVGAAKLAHSVLPVLIPSARRAQVDGQEGVLQNALDFTPLPGVVGNPGEIDGHAFDISQLDDVLLEQLFAHSLVDWILSNNDAQPHNFGIDMNGNIVGFNKGQVYKFFNGTKIQSERAQRKQGIEANLDRQKPDFNQLYESPAFLVHALLRDQLRKKKIKINFDAVIIQKTIKKIVAITHADLEDCFQKYGRHVFRADYKNFIESVYARCQDVPRIVQAFRDSIGL